MAFDGTSYVNEDSVSNELSSAISTPPETVPLSTVWKLLTSLIVLSADSSVPTSISFADSSVSTSISSDTAVTFEISLSSAETELIETAMMKIKVLKQIKYFLFVLSPYFIFVSNQIKCS